MYIHVLKTNKIWTAWKSSPFTPVALLFSVKDLSAVCRQYRAAPFTLLHSLMLQWAASASHHVHLSQWGENYTSSNRERESGIFFFSLLFHTKYFSWSFSAHLFILLIQFFPTTHTPWHSNKVLLAWDGHFSFARESVVHRPCVWWPPRDLLHDLSLLHPLQLWHVGHDASAAGLKTLCCF